MDTFRPTPLNRSACPHLRGHVHFEVPPVVLHGLVTDEEVCGSFVNVAGLIALVFERRSASYGMRWSAVARDRWRQLCTVVHAQRADHCVDTLRSAATCGAHAECTNARWFLADILLADEDRPWGRAHDAASQDSSDASPTLSLYLQRQHGRSEVTVPSGAGMQGEQIAAPGTSPVVVDEDAQRQDAPSAQGTTPDATFEAAVEVTESPSIKACIDSAEMAIAQTQGTMEDFLLRKRRSSPSALRGLRLLHSALNCSRLVIPTPLREHATMSKHAPTIAKVWYRFGFLMHRHADLPRASALALQHACSLNPPTAGPAYAELTLLQLRSLATDPGVDETELIGQVL